MEVRSSEGDGKKHAQANSERRSSVRGRRRSLNSKVVLEGLNNALKLPDLKKERLTSVQGNCGIVRNPDTLTASEKNTGMQMDMSEAFPNVSKWTLCFNDVELEEAFKMHISGLTRGKVRRAFLALALFHLLLGIMEPLLGYSHPVASYIGLGRFAGVILNSVFFFMAACLSEKAFYSKITKRLPGIYFTSSLILFCMSLCASLEEAHVSPSQCPKYSFFSGIWSLPTELFFVAVLFLSGMRINWALLVFTVHLLMGLVAPVLMVIFANLFSYRYCFYNWSVCYVPLLGVLCGVQCYTSELQIRRDFITRCNICKDRKRRNEIIESMLPRDIAEKLMEGIRPLHLRRKFEMVTIMFVYVANFKELSLHFGAAEIVSFLHRLYSQFDYATDHRNVYKVEAIAESYICMTGGLRGVPNTDCKEPDKAVRMAELMMAIASTLCTPDNKPVILKIGIHTGKVVAGITGSKSYSYHMFGDTVNTASRMASTCKQGAVQLSEATYQAISTESRSMCKSNEPVMCKGKGVMQTYSPVFDAENVPVILKSFVRFLKIKNQYNPIFAEASSMSSFQSNLHIHITASGNEKSMMEMIRVKGLKFVYKKKDGSYLNIQNAGTQPTFGITQRPSLLFTTPRERDSADVHSQKFPSSRVSSQHSERKVLENNSYRRVSNQQLWPYQSSQSSLTGAKALRRSSLQFTTPRERDSSDLASQRLSSSRVSSQHSEKKVPENKSCRRVSNQQHMPFESSQSSLDGSRVKSESFVSNRCSGAASENKWASLRRKSSVIFALQTLNTPTLPVAEHLSKDATIPDAFKNLEADFCRSNDVASLPTIRQFFYTVAAIILTVLYFFDIILQDEMTLIVKARITIRLATLGLIMGLIYASHKWEPDFNHNLQLINACAAVLFCLQANQELLFQTTCLNSNIAINIIIIFAISTLMGLRYFYTNVATVCCILIYGIILFLHTDQPRITSAGYIACQLFSACVGSFQCFQLEIEQRYSYLHNAILEHDNLLSERLLKNMFPGSHHIHALIKDIPVFDDLDRVTILFSDFKGYTAWCNAQEDPEKVYMVLNKIYNAFDKHLDEQGVYKLETIGDAFVVVAGLKGFKSCDNHALAMIKFAFCILYELEIITKQMNLNFVMRIGIHTGPAVGGVVGIKKPRYLCWGKSSLIANLLESCGTPGRILVSKETLMELTSQQLSNNCLEREENPNEVKLGEEIIQSYFINGDARRFVTITLDKALSKVRKEVQELTPFKKSKGLSALRFINSERNFISEISQNLKRVGSNFSNTQGAVMPSVSFSSSRASSQSCLVEELENNQHDHANSDLKKLVKCTASTKQNQFVYFFKKHVRLKSKRRSSKMRKPHKGAPDKIVVVPVLGEKSSKSTILQKNNPVFDAPVEFNHQPTQTLWNRRTPSSNSSRDIDSEWDGTSTEQLFTSSHPISSIMEGNESFPSFPSSPLSQTTPAWANKPGVTPTRKSKQAEGPYEEMDLSGPTPFHSGLCLSPEIGASRSRDTQHLLEMKNEDFEQAFFPREERSSSQSEPENDLRVLPTEGTRICIPGQISQLDLPYLEIKNRGLSKEQTHSPIPRTFCPENPSIKYERHCLSEIPSRIESFSDECITSLSPTTESVQHLLSAFEC